MFANTEAVIMVSQDSHRTRLDSLCDLHLVVLKLPNHTPSSISSASLSASSSSSSFSSSLSSSCSSSSSASPQRTSTLTHHDLAGASVVATAGDRVCASVSTSTWLNVHSGSNPNGLTRFLVVVYGQNHLIASSTAKSKPFSVALLTSQPVLLSRVLLRTPAIRSAIVLGMLATPGNALSAQCFEGPTIIRTRSDGMGVMCHVTNNSHVAVEVTIELSGQGDWREQVVSTRGGGSSSGGSGGGWGGWGGSSDRIVWADTVPPGHAQLVGSCAFKRRRGASFELSMKLRQVGWLGHDTHDPPVPHGSVHEPYRVV